jgi:hypothetical protein
VLFAISNFELASPFHDTPSFRRGFEARWKLFFVKCVGAEGLVLDNCL